jgi:hypothetical protein
MRTDLHQHAWAPQLVEQLARRRRLPRVDLESGLPLLHADGERPYVIDPSACRREAVVPFGRRDRVDQIVVAMSSPIGIETLPRAEAVQLIEAHLDVVQALGEGFLAWGPVALDESDPTDVDLLARGCVCISLRRPLRSAPTGSRRPGRCWSGWGGPELTDDVTQMQAAWLSFATDGRRLHRNPVVVFAMLAGCGPLQSERFEQRRQGAYSVGPDADLLRSAQSFEQELRAEPALV